MTVKEWLESVAGTNQSTDHDASMMQNLLRRVGFPKAVCTLGIVYPEGQGMPMDIHSMAKTLLKPSLCQH